MHDVLIIGGGIGGLTAAIALRQRGIAASVYEAAPELRAVGAGILVPPNAMQALARLGLADAVRGAGLPQARGEIRDFRGAVLQRVDLHAVEREYGYPNIAIHRARLHGALAAALDASQIHLGKTCIGVEQDRGQVRASFDDGSTAVGRVLIGADGLRSVVRRQIFPGASLRYSGQTSYRAIAPANLPADLASCGWELWGPGCRFGFAAIGAGEVYWYATVDAAPDEHAARSDVKAWLRGLFAAFPPPVASLLAATPEPAIFRTDMYDLRPLRAWHVGAVGLLGDAAHATTPNLGQGGAQAIEDAWALAECLASGAEPDAALAAYERRRRAKTALIVNRSWQIGRLAHLGHPLARAARNLLMRSVPAALVQREFERLYRVA